MPTVTNCKICKANRESEVDALLQDSVSLQKISEITGFSIQSIRTHKKHAKLAKPETKDFTGQISTQYERLKRMLYSAKQQKPDDFELHLKIENELAKSLRLLTSLNEKKLLSDALEKESSVTAQISSLTAELVSALHEYPEAQTAIRSVIKRHTD